VAPRLAAELDLRSTAAAAQALVLVEPFLHLLEGKQMKRAFALLPRRGA
jgi:hypothetical protein